MEATPLGHYLTGLLSAIPYVGAIISGLVTKLLTGENTNATFEYFRGLLDTYFLCAMGEEGFTQEIYDTDFSKKMLYITESVEEIASMSSVPYYGIFVLIMGLININDVIMMF